MKYLVVALALLLLVACSGRVVDVGDDGGTDGPRESGLDGAHGSDGTPSPEAGADAAVHGDGGAAEASGSDATVTESGADGSSDGGGDSIVSADGGTDATVNEGGAAEGGLDATSGNDATSGSDGTSGNDATGAADAGDGGDSTVGTDASSDDAGGQDAASEASTDGGAQDGTAKEAGAADGGACAANSWHTASPLPTGKDLYGIYEASATAVWAVGDSGSIIHFDGTSWSVPSSGTSANLTAIWGGSATDIWVVGQQGTALHWDGASWSTKATGTALNLTAVWGTASGDVWIAGGNPSNTAGIVAHWDGASLSTAYTSSANSFTSIWASSGSDVWVGGTVTSGDAVHWDGSAWTPMTVTGSVGVASIWGSAANDVWAMSGPNATANNMYHWDGSAWSLADVSDGGFSSNKVPGTRIYGFASSDVWTNYGAHWDGAHWSVPITCSPALSSQAQTLGGLADSDLWIAGAGGLVTRLGINATCAQQTPTFILPAGSASLWAAAFDDVYVGGEHWNGTSWSAISIPRNPNYAALTPGLVWGTSSNDVWIVGLMPDVGTGFNVGATHWNGTSWSQPVNIGAGYPGADAIGGSGTNDVYVVLRAAGVLLPEQLIHYDGSSWTNVTSGPVKGGQSVWGSSASDVYVTGSPMWRWDGTSWSNPAGAPGTGQIWGSSATDVWVTGNPPYHFDGTMWAQDTSLPFTNVASISGTGPGDIWMWADTGYWHWDGTSWFDAGSGGTGGIAATGNCTAWTAQGGTTTLVTSYGP